MRNAVPWRADFQQLLTRCCAEPSFHGGARDTDVHTDCLRCGMRLPSLTAVKVRWLRFMGSLVRAPEHCLETGSYRVLQVTLRVILTKGKYQFLQ